MTGNDGYLAADYARLAAGHSNDEMADAVGEGLAAVAFAILELASAIRSIEK